MSMCSGSSHGTDGEGARCMDQHSCWEGTEGNQLKPCWPKAQSKQDPGVTCHHFKLCETSGKRRQCDFAFSFWEAMGKMSKRLNNLSPGKFSSRNLPKGNH